MKDPEFMMDVVKDIMKERRRQVEKEGFSETHDDCGLPGVLSVAASAYVINAACVLHPADGAPIGSLEDLPLEWPWDQRWWKPKNPKRDLERAAALIIAELEKLKREEKRHANDARAAKAV